MIGPVKASNLDIHNGEAGKDTIFSSFFSTFANSRDILFRNNPSLDFIRILKP